MGGVDGWVVWMVEMVGDSMPRGKGQGKVRPADTMAAGAGYGPHAEIPVDNICGEKVQRPSQSTRLDC